MVARSLYHGNQTGHNMKLIIAYLTYPDPSIIQSLKGKIEALSFSALEGFGKSSSDRQFGMRVEKYCEDDEVDAIIASIRECITWIPPEQPTEETKQELLGQGYTEEQIRAYDPVRPNGEDLGKIIVLPADGVYSVLEKDA
jgi:hypothetical protein